LVNGYLNVEGNIIDQAGDIHYILLKEDKMVVIRSLLALTFIIGSLVISYNYSPRAFCFLAVTIMFQFVFEAIKEG
jgi:hypothetical protein